MNWWDCGRRLWVCITLGGNRGYSTWWVSEIIVLKNRLSICSGKLWLKIVLSCIDSAFLTLSEDTVKTRDPPSQWIHTKQENHTWSLPQWHRRRLSIMYGCSYHVDVVCAMQTVSSDRTTVLHLCVCALRSYLSLLFRVSLADPHAPYREVVVVVAHSHNLYFADT